VLEYRAPGVLQGRVAALTVPTPHVGTTVLLLAKLPVGAGLTANRVCAAPPPRDSPRTYIPTVAGGELELVRRARDVPVTSSSMTVVAVGGVMLISAACKMVTSLTVPVVIGHSPYGLLVVAPLESWFTPRARNRLLA